MPSTMMAVLDPKILNPCLAEWSQHSRDIVRELSSPAAYPHEVESVQHHETHISHVFLAGEFAYKIKKPIKTDFLDYSTLEKRLHFCREEIRLDRRYADDLYIDVVPITMDDNLLHMDGNGEPIEYAVKMHRFPDDALLSFRVDKGLLSTAEIRELAVAVADFHDRAAKCDRDRAFHVPTLLFDSMKEICETLSAKLSDKAAAALHVVHDWSDSYFTEHLQAFGDRSEQGMIRECHGDLHLQNIVHWKGRLVPFDGIEFNEEFRWIDIVSDAAFLAMDLAARGHLDLSRSFVNSYLERTGDYSSVIVMRWYLVYRSLIRAMVAQMKADQHAGEPEIVSAAMQDCHDHIDLAYRFTLVEEPSLTITHGLSGSGKTTISELVVQRHGAIRLRSDTERKRLFDVSLDRVISDAEGKRIYNDEANQDTYRQLENLAAQVIAGGLPVVIDATFLRRSDRERFKAFAIEQGVHFAILHCKADVATLRQRIADRIAASNDVSDADLSVLELQLQSREQLSADEEELCVEVPDVVSAIDKM